ncbi:hypothetical protein C2G38_2193911 [Gigaspora rosea]|uniref:Uncharacterized protein n=1 Tax=Gigaspora rosea TaxID=44941 RepID=A0A397UZ16_9GLOM|nr:hypothetical protein C2G38_2193911 [Gigaspora rosea]
MYYSGPVLVVKQVVSREEINLEEAQKEVDLQAREQEEINLEEINLGRILEELEEIEEINYQAEKLEEKIHFEPELEETIEEQKPEKIWVMML